MVQNLEISKYSFRAFAAKSIPKGSVTVMPRTFISSHLKDRSAMKG